MPAVSAARPAWLAGFALCAASACSETPIEAITSADVSAAGAPAETPPPPDAGPGAACDVRLEAAAAGVVTIEAVESGQCLTQGPATMVADEPAFEVLLESCDESLEQRWRLIEAEFASFEVRSVATDDNLDIQFAATTDGTPAVLFEPHQLYNQRFLFGPRADGSLSVSPRHAALKCLQQAGAGVQIWPCAGSEPAQGFVLRACR